MADELAEISCLGTKENYGWICVGYDIQYRYGYETMLSLLDRFVSEYAVRVDRIDKAMLAGMAPDIVWKKWLFNKPQPLSQMEALKEECGQVSVGGVSRRLSDIQLYVTMTNQTSIITIQVPQENYSDAVKREMDIAVQFIQATLVSAGIDFPAADGDHR